MYEESTAAAFHLAEVVGDTLASVGSLVPAEQRRAAHVFAASLVGALQAQQRLSQPCDLLWIHGAPGHAPVLDASLVKACTDAMPTLLAHVMPPHHLLPFAFVLHLRPGAVSLRRASLSHPGAPLDALDHIWGDSVTPLQPADPVFAPAQTQAPAPAPVPAPASAPHSIHHDRHQNPTYAGSGQDWRVSASLGSFLPSSRSPSALSGTSASFAGSDVDREGSRASSVLSTRSRPFTHTRSSTPSDWYSSSDVSDDDDEPPVPSVRHTHDFGVGPAPSPGTRISTSTTADAVGDETVLRQTAQDLGLLNFMAGCDESMIQRFGDDPAERSADLTITNILPPLGFGEPDTPAARRAFFSADGAAARAAGPATTARSQASPLPQSKVTQQGCGRTKARRAPPAPLCVAPHGAQMHAQASHGAAQARYDDVPHSSVLPSYTPIAASPVRRAHPSRQARRDARQRQGHRPASSSVSSLASLASSGPPPASPTRSKAIPLRTQPAAPHDTANDHHDKENADTATDQDADHKLQVFDKGNVHVLGGGVKLGVAAAAAATTATATTDTGTRTRPGTHGRIRAHAHSATHARTKSSGDVLVRLQRPATAASATATHSGNVPAHTPAQRPGHVSRSSQSLRAGAAQWYPRAFGSDGQARANAHASASATSSATTVNSAKTNTAGTAEPAGSTARAPGAAAGPAAVPMHGSPMKQPPTPAAHHAHGRTGEHSLYAAMASSLATPAPQHPPGTALPTFLAEQAEQYLRCQMAHPQGRKTHAPGTSRSGRNWLAA